MKRNKFSQRVLTSLLVLSFVLQISMPVHAAAYVLGYVIKDEPIYSIASDDVDIVCMASKGDVVKIYKTNHDFYKIGVGSGFGYLKKSKVLVGSTLQQYVRQHPSLFQKVASVVSESAGLYTSQRSRKPKISIECGTKICVDSIDNKWTKVLMEDAYYWVKSSDISVVYSLTPTVYTIVSSFRPIYTDLSIQEVSDRLTEDGSLGAQIAKYGLQFIGNDYVWGGTSLTGGADCSGFVQSLYKVFGYTIPRVSYNQANFGTRVSLDNLEPGDLVFYKTSRGYKVSSSGIGHVAMYVGDGMIVQAQDSEHGIVLSKVDFIKPAWACRIIE